MELKVEKDYPTLAIPNKNFCDANILYPLYSGKDSETTAITQYIFQHYTTNLSPLKEVLLSIAINEMHHHELLGEAIYMLGTLPMFADGRYFWKGNFVCYNTNPKEILELNIIAEQKAIKNYNNSLLYIQNDSIKSLINRIIEDEQLHLDTLKDLYYNEYNY